MKNKKVNKTDVWVESQNFGQHINIEFFFCMKGNELSISG